MQIQDFIKEYDLHDSLIEKIQLNREKLTLTIDLCNWRQKNYNSNEQEMKKITVIFDNVQNYNLDRADDIVNSDSILEIHCTDVDSSTKKDIKLIFTGESDIKIMTFQSESVTVE